MSRLCLALATALAAAAVLGRAAPRRPNIIVILTDDQDLDMASMEYMPKLKEHLVDEGLTFQRFYAAVPVCCPSRSAFISGMYQHNNMVVGNTVGANCSSYDWQSGPELLGFASFLNQAGYATSYAGKYLNEYGKPEAGGVSHVPGGWDEWHVRVSR